MFETCCAVAGAMDSRGFDGDSAEPSFPPTSGFIYLCEKIKPQLFYSSFAPLIGFPSF